MGAPPQVSLDYGSDNLPADQRKKLLGSLSAVTEANGFLWTAADEGRTLECLKRDGNKGYARKQQYQLDEIFGGLPGEREAKPRKRISNRSQSPTPNSCINGRSKVNGSKAKSAGRGVVKQREHPEAFCWFLRQRNRGKRARGLIVLYDSPDKRHHRIKKHRRYSADWIPHPK